MANGVAALPAPLPDAIDLRVFEDTPGGIRSTLQAVQLLRLSGIRVQVSAWGITVNADNKTAHERVGAVVFSDVNQAIGAAFPGCF